MQSLRNAWSPVSHFVSKTVGGSENGGTAAANDDPGASDAYLTENEEKIWRALVFQVMYMVARKFDFQTFNRQANGAVVQRDGAGNPVLDADGRFATEPGDVWVPATAFVACDHLCQLLISDGMPREGVLSQKPLAAGPGGSNVPRCVNQLAFSKAVWRLHATVFLPYKQWAKHQQRVDEDFYDFPRADVSEFWANRTLDTFEAAFVGLLDLCLYFGLWTEAANVRHMPEAVWFFFWCMRHSSSFDELLRGPGSATNPSTAGASELDVLLDLRARRVKMRNECADIIATARNRPEFMRNDRSVTMDANGSSLPVYDRIVAAQVGSCHNLGERGMDAVHSAIRKAAEALGGAKSAQGATAAREIAADLIAFGDGGRFSERVITPLFQALAFEVNVKGGAGVEAALRITYDDANESFVQPVNVSRIFETLLESVRKTSQDTGTGRRDRPSFLQLSRHLYKLICNLGNVSDENWSVTAARDVYKGSATKPGWLRKTYQERRTWLALYRAYFRVLAFHVLVFHGLLAVAFEDKKEGRFVDRWWVGLSGMVVTHAVMELVYGYAGMYLTLPVAAPPAANTQTRRVLHLDGLLPTLWQSFCCCFQFVTRRERDITDIEKQQAENRDKLMWRVHSLRTKSSFARAFLLGAFWFAAVLALAVLYVLQFVVKSPTNPQEGERDWRETLENIWGYVAAGYGVVMVLHFWLTFRFGYIETATSLAGYVSRTWTYLLRLCNCLGTPAARLLSYPEYVAENPGVGLRRGLLNMLFWTTVLAIKGAFDYFLLIRNLVDPIRGLLEVDWFGTCGDDLVISGTEIPCVDNLLLVVALCLPAFVVVLVDTAVFYQIGVFLYGCTNGLVYLQLGQITCWDDVVREMHSCAENFSQKVLSSDALRGWQSGKSVLGYYNALARWHAKAAGSSNGGPGSVNGAAGSSNGVAESQPLHHGAASDSASWVPFMHVWDKIVEDLCGPACPILYENDLVSKSEQTNLEFTLIPELQSYGCQPLVLPAIFFAGRIQAAMERNSAPERVTVRVIRDMYNLLLVLITELGLLGSTRPGTDKSSEAARARFATLSALRLVPTPQSSYHLAVRTRLVTAVRDFVRVLMRVASTDVRSNAAVRREAVLHFSVLCAQLQIEIAYSKKLYDTVEQQSQNAVLLLLSKVLEGARNDETGDAVSGMRSTKNLWTKAVPAKPDEMAAVVAETSDDDVIRAESTLCRRLEDISMGSESGGSSRVRAIKLLITTLQKAFTLTEDQAKPRNEEACRTIRFFMSSLFNPQLQTPRPLREMMSLTTLVPHYAEDVIYALNAAEVGERTGKRPRIGEMSDLVSPMKGYEVSTMEFLRILSADEWRNFVDRMAAKYADRVTLETTAGITEADFEVGGGGCFSHVPEARMDLMLWASNRGQLLARTVRGMMLYERGLRLLAGLEHADFLDVADGSEADRRLQKLLESKYRHVVSSQVYGAKKASGKPADKWLAYAVDYLLEINPSFRVAYIDTVKGAAGAPSVQYSVLMRWDVELGRVVDEYRVRLPSQTENKLGVVIGEGKPENQNHAVVFCFGEALQTVDMNQENRLAEAVKMRNLLSEFNTGFPQNHKSRTENNTLNFRKLSLSHITSKPPVALVGFREWIFSGTAGALGAFAAGSEFAFGTIVQRTMDNPGGARFHYGHPDVWNKLFTMTRGGVSKATKAFHVSEDVFGGYNAVFRGAQIKYREYISVGKARDVGFEQINGFESKVAGGNGEQVMSRDVFRLGSRFDWFRLMSWYHSGIGFFMNTTLVMASVYLSLWVLFVFALAEALRVSVPPGPNARAVLPAEDRIVVPAINSIQIVQLGFLSIIPYWGELCLETGVISGSVNILRQMLAGSLLFFIFRQQTSAHYFSLITYYGGAKYIATGRGFALTHSSYTKLFTAFGRSHMYFGFQLALMAIMLAFLNIPSYFLSTWGTWLVAVSLFFSPFWFNPVAFDTSQVVADFEGWRRWMSGNVDPVTKQSWYNFHKDTMEKPRNATGKQTDHFWNRAGGVAMQFFNLVIFIAVGERLVDPDFKDVVDAETGAVTRQRDDGSVTRKVVGIAIFELILFSFLVLLVVRRTFRNFSQTSQRVISISYILLVIAMGVLFITTFGKNASTGFSDFVLLAFANFTLGTIVVQLLLYIIPYNSISLRVVDFGYYVVDAAIGYITFAYLFLLALLPLVDTIQATLLFNYEFLKETRAGQLQSLITGRRNATAAAPSTPAPAPPQQPVPAVQGGGDGVRRRAAAADAA